MQMIKSVNFSNAEKTDYNQPLPSKSLQIIYMAYSMYISDTHKQHIHTHTDSHIHSHILSKHTFLTSSSRPTRRVFCGRSVALIAFLYLEHCFFAEADSITFEFMKVEPIRKIGSQEAPK